MAEQDWVATANLDRSRRRRASPNLQAEWRGRAEAGYITRESKRYTPTHMPHIQTYPHTYTQAEQSCVRNNQHTIGFETDIMDIIHFIPDG